MTSVAVLVGVLLPVLGAANPASAVPFECSPGIVYSLERDTEGGAAYVTRVDPSTGSTTRWPGQFPTPRVNALALADGGFAAYAVAVPTDADLTTLYELSSEGAATVVASDLAVEGVTPARLVAGAINPATGIYYFGGFTLEDVGGQTRDIFELHAFDLRSGTYQGLVGRALIEGSEPSPTANGDISFDRQGNLFVVWSNDDGQVNKLVRVDAADVPVASGSDFLQTTLLSSPAGSPTAIPYNGMTFDSDGVLYLEAGVPGETTLSSVDPNTGEVSRAQAVSMGVGEAYGVDLASCSYPPTLQLAKDIQGRYPASAQFTYRISLQRDPDAAIGSATSTGSSSGVQAEIAGPVVAVTGAVYRIEEVGVDTDPGWYDSTYSCTWGTETTPFASGPLVLEGGEKSAILPAIPGGRAGQQLSCTMVNTLRPALLTLGKTVAGGTAVPTDWTLRADGLTPIAGTTGSPQVTQAVVSAGSYALSESGPRGYALSGLVCTSAAGASVAGVSPTQPSVTVLPGDEVTCVFANTAVLPATGAETSVIGLVAAGVAVIVVGAVLLVLRRRSVR